jgi:hypothetical protein
LSDERLLTIIATQLLEINQKLGVLVDRVGKKSMRIACGTRSVATPGDPSSIGNVGDLPFEAEVVIKALPSNAGIVYLGNSKVEASDRHLSFPLSPGDAISYRIGRSGVYVDAVVAGDGVAWTTEIP